MDEPLKFNTGGLGYHMEDFEAERKNSASPGKRETRACLKLSAGKVSGGSPADLLNNSEPCASHGGWESDGGICRIWFFRTLLSI